MSQTSMRSLHAQPRCLLVSDLHVFILVSRVDVEACVEVACVEVACVEVERGRDRDQPPSLETERHAAIFFFLSNFSHSPPGACCALGFFPGIFFLGWVSLGVETPLFEQPDKVLCVEYTYMHTCIHTCIHRYIHACMHACMYACMHACMHTYIHTYLGRKNTNRT